MDAAVQEVEKLEKQLETLRNTKPVVQTATKPTTVPMPQRSLKELQQALDDANARGDQDEVKAVYKELRKVRGY